MSRERDESECGRVKLHTLWTVYEPGGHDPAPSLIVAWDEGTIDANPEGWEEAKEKAMAEFGAYRSKHEFREVVIEVPGLWSGVLERFAPGQMRGKLL